jgi:hypothetical protein
MRRARRALLLVPLLLPLAARPEPALSLRLAYAAPLGSAAPDLPLADAMLGQVPVQLDALWRFGAASAGLYGSWGPGQVPGDTCGGGADCSASALRLGIEGEWMFAPLGAWRLSPWAGIGAGWERASTRRTRLGAETIWTYSGPEASLHAGLDWPLAAGFALGPFAELAVGRYGSWALDTSAESASGDLAEKAFHGFVHLGVRGTLDL